MAVDYFGGDCLCVSFPQVADSTMQRAAYYLRMRLPVSLNRLLFPGTRRLKANQFDLIGWMTCPDIASHFHQQ
jgi:hypothetical protein